MSEFIRPIGPSSPLSRAEPQDSWDILPMPKTGQAAQPVFDSAQPLAEHWPFQRSASLADDLAPLKARVADLFSNQGAISPDEMQTQIASCKLGMQKIQQQLDALEFASSYPIVEELNGDQEGSFAFNIHQMAEEIRGGL